MTTHRRHVECGQPTCYQLCCRTVQRKHVVYSTCGVGGEYTCVTMVIIVMEMQSSIRFIFALVCIIVVHSVTSFPLLQSAVSGTASLIFFYGATHRMIVWHNITVRRSVRLFVRPSIRLSVRSTHVRRLCIETA